MMASKARRNTLPRKSSPAGVDARAERRVKAFTPEIKKGGAGYLKANKPGSRNPKKVGR